MLLSLGLFFVRVDYYCFLLIWCYYLVLVLLFLLLRMRSRAIRSGWMIFIRRRATTRRRVCVVVCMYDVDLLFIYDGFIIYMCCVYFIFIVLCVVCCLCLVFDDYYLRFDRVFWYEFRDVVCVCFYECFDFFVFVIFKYEYFLIDGIE